MTTETAGWLAQLGWGALITLALGMSSMALGLLMGLAGAMARLSRHRALRRTALFYTSVIRGIPEILTILLIYYGLQALLGVIWGQFGARTPNLHPFIGGTIALGVVTGAYATEVLRGAILSVPAGQIEAARALGLPRRVIVNRVLLPQAMRIALPGLGNVWLVLLKETALVSAISLDELLRLTQLVVNVTKQPFLWFGVACLFYLALTVISTLGQRALERRYGRGLDRDGVRHAV